MAWTFNSVRVFVSKRTGSAKQIIPVLQPISGGSVYQFFGWETETVQISGLIVGATDLRALLALIGTATSYSLVSPEGTIGNFFLKEFKYNRLPVTNQTIRTDLACEAPVYEVDLDLLPDGTVSL